MRGLWIAVAMTVALPSEALAEYMPPSDVDLKAAYCVGRLQEVSTVVTEALPEASRAGAVEVNARIDAARIRLRAYILPRLKFVDGSGMIAATNIGASDQRAYAVAIQGCLAALPNTATTADKEAFSACYIKAGWPKLRECQYVEFLPF